MRSVCRQESLQSNREGNRKMAVNLPRRRTPLGLSLLILLVVAQAGCIGLANLIHAVKGDNLPAEFDGLKGQRVAVITITDSTQYSDDISARLLSQHVREVLNREVKDLKAVREEDIEQWRDTNGWDSIDYAALGKGVKADKVLAIELTDLRLRDGATLYRGRAGVTTIVYDVASGKREFRRHLEEFTYPVSVGQYASETTEARFRRVYLTVLAQRVARYFHPYNFRDSVAEDARIVNQ
jgi:hypothetical protein